MEKNSSCEVACTLTPVEMQKRRAEVLDNIKQHIQEQRQLPDGYVFCFDGDIGRAYAAYGGLYIIASLG